jgi:hypothetical protein
VKVVKVEGPTKTRQGGLNKQPRKVSQKLYGIGVPNAQLPAKRPTDPNRGAIYLNPLRKERVFMCFNDQ